MPSKTRSKETVSSKKRAEVADLENALQKANADLSQYQDKNLNLEHEIGSIEKAQAVESLNGERMLVRDLRDQLNRLNEKRNSVFQNYQSMIQDGAKRFLNIRQDIRKLGSDDVFGTGNHAAENAEQSDEDRYKAELDQCRLESNKLNKFFEEEIASSRCQEEEAREAFEKFKKEHPGCYELSSTEACIALGGGVVGGGAAALFEEEAAAFLLAVGAKAGAKAAVKEGGIWFVKEAVKEGGKQLATGWGCGALGGGVTAFIFLAQCGIHYRSYCQKEEKLREDKEKCTKSLDKWNGRASKLHKRKTEMVDFQTEVNAQDRFLHNLQDEREKLLRLKINCSNGQVDTLANLLDRLKGKIAARERCSAKIENGKQLVEELESELEKVEESHRTVLRGNANQGLFNNPQNAHAHIVAPAGSITLSP